MRAWLVWVALVTLVISATRWQGDFTSWALAISGGAALVRAYDPSRLTPITESDWPWWLRIVEVLAQTFAALFIVPIELLGRGLFWLASRVLP